MEFAARTTIAAPPEVVWAVLVDTSSWHEWDPYCERIEGEVEVGAKLRAYSTLSPGRTFPVQVALVEAPRHMVWRGGMPLGLFRAERTFTLSPNAQGGTDFEVREVFAGAFLPLFKGSIPDLSEAFLAFAGGLKERSEA